METKPKEPRRIHIHYCRYGRLDRRPGRYQEVEVDRNGNFNAPEPMVYSWAKSGCKQCNGSGRLVVFTRNGSKKRIYACRCAERRFAKAHPWRA